MVKTGFVWVGNCSDKGKPVSRKKLKQMVPLLEQHRRAKYRAVRAKLKALRRARNRQNELRRAAAKTAQSVQVPLPTARTPGILARFWLWLRRWLGRVPPTEGHVPGPPASQRWPIFQGKFSNVKKDKGEDAAYIAAPGTPPGAKDWRKLGNVRGPVITKTKQEEEAP